MLQMHKLTIVKLQNKNYVSFIGLGTGRNIDALGEMEKNNIEETIKILGK